MRKVIKNKTKIFNSCELIAKLNKIYEEIKEIDLEFCSKLLALTGTCFSYIISLAIFMNIFSKTNIFVKSAFAYAMVMLSLMLLFVIHMSSSVNYESKNTYKLLMSYKIVCIQTKQLSIVQARHGLKVLKFHYNFNTDFNNNYQDYSIDWENWKNWIHLRSTFYNELLSRISGNL